MMKRAEWKKFHLAFFLNNSFPINQFRCDCRLAKSERQHEQHILRSSYIQE